MRLRNRRLSRLVVIGAGGGRTSHGRGKGCSIDRDHSLSSTAHMLGPLGGRGKNPNNTPCGSWRAWRYMHFPAFWLGVQKAIFTKVGYYQLLLRSFGL
jgi:hypothetical protein